MKRSLTEVSRTVPTNTEGGGVRDFCEVYDSAGKKHILVWAIGIQKKRKLGVQR